METPPIYPNLNTSLPPLSITNDIESLLLDHNKITSWSGKKYNTLKELENVLKQLPNLTDIDFGFTYIDRTEISTLQFKELIDRKCIPLEKIKKLNLGLTHIKMSLATHFPNLTELSVMKNRTASYESINQVQKSCKSLSKICTSLTGLNLLVQTGGVSAYINLPSTTDINWSNQYFKNTQDMILTLQLFPKLSKLNLEGMRKQKDNNSSQNPGRLINNEDLKCLMKAGCLNRITDINISNTDISLEDMEAPKGLKTLLARNCTITPTTADTFLGNRSTSEYTLITNWTDDQQNDFEKKRQYRLSGTQLAKHFHLVLQKRAVIKET